MPVFALLPVPVGMVATPIAMAMLYALGTRRGEPVTLFSTTFMHT